MQHYYLGQWVWNDSEPNYPYWEAPHQEVHNGAIDLRTLAQQAIAGGSPEGYAIFSYSILVDNPDLIYLGYSKNAILTSKVKNSIEKTLNLKTAIQATSIADFLHELLFIHADPKGETAHKPLMPNTNLDCRISLGSEGTIKTIKIIPEVSSEWNKIVSVYQEDYKKALLSINPTTIAKNLDFLEKQYGISYDKFIPIDATEIITPLPHETTITENFNTADSTTLGPTLSWTETRNDLEVKSNKATTSSGAVAIARAESDLSSADQYSQATLTYDSATNGVSNQMGVAVRHHASDVTCYWGGYNTFSTPSDRLRIEKIVTGTITNLVGPDTSGTATSPVTLKLTVSGSDLEFFVGGVSRLTITDTSITGNLRCGIIGGCATVTSTQLDDWEAGDLGTNVTVTPSALSISSTLGHVLWALTGTLSLLSPTVTTDGSITVSVSTVTIASSLVAPTIFPSTDFVQVIVSGESADTLFTASDCYCNLLNAPGAVWNNAIDNTNRSLIPTPGYFKNLRVRLATAPSSGKSWVFTVLKNDVSTGITLTISDTNTTGSDLSNLVHVVAGDTVSLKASPSGTPTSTVATWTVDFVPNTANYCIFTASHYTPSNAQGDFGCPVGTYAWESLETYAQVVAPCSGTIRDLYVSDTTAPGSGNSYDLMFRKNAVDTALHANLADLNTIASDTSNTVSVSAGDALSFQYNPTSSPSGDTPLIAWVFVTDNDSEFPIMAQGLWSVVTGATYYLPVNGCDFGSGGAGTSSNRIELTNDAVVKKIQVKIIGAALPGGGSKTYTLRKNGVNTNLTVTITSPDTTGTASVNIPVEDGDYLDTIVTQSGALSGVRTDLVSYVLAHDVTITPSALTIVSSLNTPVIDVLPDVLVTPFLGQLVLQTNASTVTSGGDVTVIQNALTLASSLPSISVITNSVLSVSALTITSSILSPIVSTGDNVEISASALTIVSSAAVGTVNTTSDVTIIPFPVTITGSLNAPTVTSGITISLSSLTLISSVNSPSILRDYVQNIAALTIVSFLNAPSISAGSSVTVSLGALTLAFSVNSPSILLDWVQSVSNVTLVGSLNSPSVSTGSAVTVSLDPLTLVSSSLAPSLSLDSSYTVGTLTIASAIVSPTISTSGNISISLGVLTLTSSLNAPSISTGATITPNNLSLSLSILAPSIAYDRVATVSSLTIVSSLIAPLIQTDGNTIVELNALTIVSSIVNPNINYDFVVGVNSQTIVSSVNSPTLSLGSTAELNSLIIIGSVVAPTLLLDTQITNNSLTLVSSLLAPSVSTSGNITISVGSLTLASSINNISVIGDANISTSAAIVTSSVNASTIITAGNVSISLNTLSLVFSLNAPIIVITSNVTVSLNTLSVVSSTLTVVNITDVTIIPSALILSSSLAVPTFSGGITVSVNNLSIVSSLLNLALSLENVLSLNSLEIVSVLNSPTIQASGNVVIGLNSLTVISDINAVIASIAIIVYTNAITATLSIQSPSLSVIRNVTVAPNKLELALSLLTPTINALRLKFPVIVRIKFEENVVIENRFEESLDTRFLFQENEVISSRIDNHLKFDYKAVNIRDDRDIKIKLK